MKKSVLFGMAAAVVVLAGSCGGGQQQQVAYEGDTVSVEDIIRDRTIYGICSDGTAMNTLELITDNGDTLTLGMATAQEGGKVYGGLQVGDRLAVLANKQKTEATQVINLNTLLGDWVMPDPIDGQDEVGIRIKEGGVAESIDLSTVTYRTWKINNGRLEIESIREGGGDEEEQNLYEILILGPDTLAYRTIDKPQDEMETFEYSRWKEKPQPDLHGLKLEDTYDEFNKM